MTQRSTAARLWFLATAGVVAVGLVVQLYVTATDPPPDPFFPDDLARTLNVFAFFTIQSNLLVLVTSLLLAIDPDRHSLLFRTLRLDGVLCIAVTGVVFAVALEGLQDLRGSAALADFMLHKASPILCVLGWLLFGPRGLVDRRVVGWSIAFPVAWLVFTLIRGEAIGFWPYPFLDVDDLGWARALLNCVAVAVLFLGLALVALALDRWLVRRRATTDSSTTVTSTP